MPIEVTASGDRTLRPSSTTRHPGKRTEFEFLILRVISLEHDGVDRRGRFQVGRRQAVGADLAVREERIVDQHVRAGSRQRLCQQDGGRVVALLDVGPIGQSQNENRPAGHAAERPLPGGARPGSACRR